jgi:putative ABC transport system ATP-binding protein
MDTSPIYELHGVSKTFGGGVNGVHAVRDVDLTVGEGEFVAVVGPSGSGKTTLLQLLGALDRPTAGEVLFEGRDLATLKDADLTLLRLSSIGFVFQQFNLIPTLTAAQNVEVALAPGSLRGEARRTRVHELLDAVGLGARAAHVPAKLSGGEQQRVAIARALANDPHVLLADEPTGNLDTTTGEEIVDLLRALSRERAKTLVLITHDPQIAARSSRIVRMSDGRLLPSEQTAALEAVR